LAAYLGNDLATRVHGVQRFYAIKVNDRDDSASNEDLEEPGLIFIVRFRNNAQGEETARILRRLEARDGLALIGISLRGDRAPRSRMEVAIQKHLDQMK
jgi:hypothetical protein